MIGKKKRIIINISKFKKCIVKEGDTVIIRTGDDKGKISTLSKFDRKRGLVKVLGVNEKTHFNKKTNEAPGSITKAEGWIQYSNIGLYDDQSKKAVRSRTNSGNEGIKTKSLKQKENMEDING